MFNFFMAEFSVQARHWHVLAMMLLSFIFGVFLINRQTPDVDIAVSGAYFLINTFSIQLLFLPAIIAIFCAQACTRDFEQQMASLVYASCAKIPQLLGARFLVLATLTWLAFALFACGLVIGLLFTQEYQLGLAIAAVGWSLAVIALPSVLLISAVVFAVGLATHQSVYLYLTACGLVFGYQFYLILSGSPLMANQVAPNPALMPWFTWFDPYGMTAFFQQVTDWSPAVKNQQLPSLTAETIGNRLIFLGLAAVLVVFAVKRHLSTFDIGGKQSQLRFKQMLSPLVAGIQKRGLGYCKFVDSCLPQNPVISVIATEWRLNAYSKLFFALAIALAVISGSEIYFGYVHLENLGTQAMASTLVTLDRFVGDILPRFGSLFVLILAAELSWRDRQCQFDALIKTSKISTQQLLLGRLITLYLLPLALIAWVSVLAMLLQLAFGGEIIASAYLMLFIVNGLPLITLATFCFAVHHWLHNKYFALLLSFIAYIWLDSSLAVTMGLEHPLWTLGHLPTFSYSEIIGYSGQLSLFWQTLWLRFSLAIVVLIAVFNLSSTKPLTPKTLTNRPMQLSLLSLIAASATLVVNSWYEADYQSSSARHQWKASYEKKYAFLQQQPTLKPTHIDTQFNLEPSAGRFWLDANYQLTNRSEQPISQLVFTTPKPLQYRNVKVNKGQVVEFDAQFQTYRVNFEQPIQPEESIELSFSAFYQQNDLRGVLSDNFFHTDYVYFRFIRYLPWFGYVSHYQLKDNNLRKRYDLATIETAQLEQDITAHHGDFSATLDWATLTTTVITDAQHRAVAPGQLIAKWQQDGRNAFKFQTQAPIRNLGHVLSTTLPQKTAQFAGIDVEVFFPKGKGEFAQRHLNAIGDALHYGINQFGPLNSNNIRLLPMANFFPATGYALPQSVFIGEKVGFHVNQSDNDGFDHLYRRTVHEIAHQWWGHGLNGAATEGEGVLIETLAKYTETVLLEQKYGDDYVKRLIAYEHQRYFAGRARSNINELPLYRADESHLIYSKGAAAMYALKQQLGKTAINQALALLVKNHAYPLKPATTLDLVDYLMAGKTAEQQQLIQSWFFEQHRHDFKINRASMSNDEAAYRVEFCISNTAQQSQPVQIQVLDKSQNILQKQLLVVNDSQEADYCATWLLATEPGSIVVDPDLLLLDSDRSNNQYKFAN